MSLEHVVGRVKGLLVRQVGAIPFQIARQAQDLEIFLVFDAHINQAIRLLWQRNGIRVEGAGVAALAAALLYPLAQQNQNVSSAHLKTFGSPERVAIAKSELVEALAPDGIALLNCEEPQVRAMSQKTRARVMYYGLDEKAEVWASDLQGDALHGFSFILHYHDVHMPV